MYKVSRTAALSPIFVIAFSLFADAQATEVTFSIIGTTKPPSKAYVFCIKPKPATHTEICVKRSLDSKKTWAMLMTLSLAASKEWRCRVSLDAKGGTAGIIEIESCYPS